MVYIDIWKGLLRSKWWKIAIITWISVIFCFIRSSLFEILTNEKDKKNMRNYNKK